jgi:DNA-directed RNA polymerase subunit RPC12/RpoP
MARYCGTCGSILGPDAFIRGQCPTCGSRIDAANRVEDPRNIVSSDNPTQAALGYALPERRPDRHWEDEDPNRRKGKRRSKRTRKRERIPALWVFTLLLAVALLLAGAGILALSQNHGLSFFTSSSANANVNSSGGTSTSSAAANSSTSGAGPDVATATLAPGQPTPTPRPGGSPTPIGSTPTPSATPAPTAVPVPPELSVSPTSISSLVCLGPIGGKASFTVANNGGGQMSWSASKSISGYSVSPGNGTLNGGVKQTVTVTGIWQSGTVTISAPGSTDSQQQVSINCTL